MFNRLFLEYPATHSIQSSLDEVLSSVAVKVWFLDWSTKQWSYNILVMDPLPITSNKPVQKFHLKLLYKQWLVQSARFWRFSGERLSGTYFPTTENIPILFNSRKTVVWLTLNLSLDVVARIAVTPRLVQFWNGKKISCNFLHSSNQWEGWMDFAAVLALTPLWESEYKISNIYFYVGRTLVKISNYIMNNTFITWKKRI